MIRSAFLKYYSASSVRNGLGVEVKSEAGKLIKGVRAIILIDFSGNDEDVRSLIVSMGRREV